MIKSNKNKMKEQLNENKINNDNTSSGKFRQV